MPWSTSFRARSGVVIGVKPSASKRPDGVLLQGQLQQHRLVLEEVEPVAGDPGTGLEVDQVELLAEFDVVQRLEVELGQRASCPWPVRDSPCRRRRSGRRGATGSESTLCSAASVASSSSSSVFSRPTCSRSWRPSSFRASRSAGVLGLADRLGDLVGQPVGLLHLGLLGLARAFRVRRTARRRP